MLARENPLTVQRVRRLRYRLTGASWEEMLQRLHALDYRAAIVGAHGHGKTTLMEDLGQRLAAEGWEVRSLRLQRGQGWLTAEQRRSLVDGAGRRAMWFVDGIDELSALERWRLLRERRAGGMVIAVHREGLLPTLWRCETSPRLLEALLSELGVGGEHRPGPSAERLFAEHDGNLREALRALYDVYATLPAR